MVANQPRPEASRPGIREPIAGEGEVPDLLLSRSEPGGSESRRGEEAGWCQPVARTGHFQSGGR